jgi:hypothetical protein
MCVNFVASFCLTMDIRAGSANQAFLAACHNILHYTSKLWYKNIFLLCLSHSQFPDFVPSLILFFMWSLKKCKIEVSLYAFFQIQFRNVRSSEFIGSVFLLYSFTNFFNRFLFPEFYFQELGDMSYMSSCVTHSFLNFQNF